MSIIKLSEETTYLSKTKEYTLECGLVKVNVRKWWLEDENGNYDCDYEIDKAEDEFTEEEYNDLQDYIANLN